MFGSVTSFFVEARGEQKELPFDVEETMSLISMEVNTTGTGSVKGDGEFEEE